MEVRCSYCRSYFSNDNKVCPTCGAINENYGHSINSVQYEKENRSNGNENTIPKTIEELKLWYSFMNLPREEITRFFIGKDYPGPQAFGIFKNEYTGEFIVYKNKSDGTRAIRYQGTDEAYAVNEI